MRLKKRTGWFAGLICGLLLMLILTGCGQNRAFLESPETQGALGQTSPGEQMQAQPCAHQYIWTVAVPAACTEPGQEIGTCRVCGDVTTRTLEPLGHSYRCTHTEATCQTPETRVYTCVRCADSYTETGELGEHSFVRVEEVPATCQDPGSVTFVCTRCGERDTQAGTELGPHVFETRVVEPTDSTKGYTLRTCQVCGMTEEIGTTYLEYGTEITFLLYHEVMPRDFIREAAGNPGMFVAIEDFRDQMRVLREEDCFVMPLADAVSALRGQEPIPARAVCITFDDGYKSNIEFAAPVLREYGYPAAIFMTMYYLDGQYEPQFDRRGVQRLTLEEYEPYSDLITLACHTYAMHFDLRTCELEDLAADLDRCRALYPDYNDYFAYPQGCWDRDLPPLLEEKGYLAAFTTEFRRAELGDDLYALPRFGVFGWLTEARFRGLIRGEDPAAQPDARSSPEVRGGPDMRGGPDARGGSDARGGPDMRNAPRQAENTTLPRRLSGKGDR